ncbi:snapalysin family zinc-dependent metalloprotease [Falsarthrobacter nasiphocae]|uniref:Extracellular small neutral protease n=1 Tax=Falsarthrobacter nasiphocae TaxID=189863 RepID=A0AAE3YHT8_9MICC|nr:snapalysin family zinc-dependent metalloprotease [Falsarthrobacter nasiphocae]MDR6892198.1 snapalysin [Falsarthrobacter nasiphocae]
MTHSRCTRALSGAAALISLAALSAPAASATPASAPSSSTGFAYSSKTGELVDPYAQIEVKGTSASAGFASGNGQTSSVPARRAVASQYAAGLVRAVIYYNDANAPSYRTLISQSAQIWNGSLTRVTLQRTTGRGDITYYEGNYGSEGSTARWNSPGHGTIQIDYSQTNQYPALRVVAHETGHVLGNLPDHYSGPCSELMSGGGPGPSCTNVYPNYSERQRADSNY